MGPWVHSRANVSVPGPRIDYLNEVSRFFAHWLREEDTGIMKEPPLQVYMQETWKPDRRIDNLPGVWRADPALPPAGATESVFYLAEDGRLTRSQSTGSSGRTARISRNSAYPSMSGIITSVSTRSTGVRCR